MKKIVFGITSLRPGGAERVLIDIVNHFKNDYDISTVGGWVVEKFERIPDEGDSFRYENLRVVVTKRDSRHVNEITVEVLEPQPAEDE